MSDSNRKRLESRLCPVVIVVSSYAVYVKRGTRRLSKTLKTVRDHLAAQVTNLLSFESQLNDAVWSVR